MVTKVAAISTVALFLLIGVSGSVLWNEYEDTNSKAVVTNYESFNITNVYWTRDDDVVSLKVCSDANLDDQSKNVTQISLTYTPAKSLNNDPIFGDLDETGKCVIFSDLDSDFKLSSDATNYTVILRFDDESSNTGSATFAMTVETTLLDCSESMYTKVSWKDASTELINPNCTEEPMPLDLVCYHTGDLTNRELCFTVPNEEGLPGENITVCLDGPTDNPANVSPDGDFSVSYLQYGDGPSFSPSLTLGPDGTATSAVIVETDDGRSTVHSCSGNTCLLSEEFMPSTKRYQVCGELEAEQTAAAEFYDLHLTIFEAAAHPQQEEVSQMLQFIFANALPSKAYEASLWQDMPPGEDTALTSVLINCDLVEVGHGCFGYLDASALAGEAYLGVANAEDGMNRVIVPYSTGISTTAGTTTPTETTPTAETTTTAETTSTTTATTTAEPTSTTGSLS